MLFKLNTNAKNQFTMEKLIIPSILTVPDVITIVDSVLKLTSPFTSTETKIKNLNERCSQILDRLVKNQKSSLKSEFTEELIRLDKRRDQAYVCVRDVVHGISVSLITSDAEKATKLYAILEKLGTNAHRLNYKAETAILMSLFVEFDKPENHQLLADLGISSYYNSLKEAQTEFENVAAQKSDEKTAQNADTEAATAIVVEMIPALTSLVALMQVYADLEPATYSEAYGKIVTVISETNTVARARKTRKQTKTDEETKVK